MDENKLHLERIKYGVRIALSRELGEEIDPEVSILIDERVGYEIVTALFKLWGKTIEDVRFDYPANWIEAIKARWLPNWLKKRWPIRYHTWQYNMAAVYPKLLALKLPEQDRFLLPMIQAYDYIDNGKDDWGKLNL